MPLARAAHLPTQLAFYRNRKIKRCFKCIGERTELPIKDTAFSLKQQKNKEEKSENSHKKLTQNSDPKKTQLYSSSEA